MLPYTNVSNVSKSSENVEMLRQLQKVVGKYGVNFVTKELRRLDERSSNKHTERIINHVLESVSKRYAIDIKDLMYSQKRGDTVVARKLCFILLNMNMEVGQEYIAEYFGKTRKVVGRALSEFVQCEVIDSKGKNFHKHFDEITKEINDLKVQLNGK